MAFSLHFWFSILGIEKLLPCPILSWNTFQFTLSIHPSNLTFLFTHPIQSSKSPFQNTLQIHPSNSHFQFILHIYCFNFFTKPESWGVCRCAQIGNPLINGGAVLRTDLPSFLLVYRYIYLVPFLLVPIGGVPNGWVPNGGVPNGWVPIGGVPNGWVPIG